MAEKEEVISVHSKEGEEVIGVHSKEEGEVIIIHSMKAWKEQIKKGKESKKLIVVDFTAPWCGACHWIAPFFEGIVKKTPNVIFLRVDVDELNNVADECGVTFMPTYLFIKQGKFVDKVGPSKPGLTERIAKYATNELNARGLTKRIFITQIP